MKKFLTVAVAGDLFFSLSGLAEALPNVRGTDALRIRLVYDDDLGPTWCDCQNSSPDPDAHTWDQART